MTQLSGQMSFDRYEEETPEKVLREFFWLVKGQLDTLSGAADRANGVVPSRILKLDLTWQLDSGPAVPETGIAAMAETLARQPEQEIQLDHAAEDLPSAPTESNDLCEPGTCGVCDELRAMIDEPEPDVVADAPSDLDWVGFCGEE